MGGVVVGVVVAVVVVVVAVAVVVVVVAVGVVVGVVVAVVVAVVVVMPHVPIEADPRDGIPRPAGPSYFASKGAFVRDPRGGSGGKGPREDAPALKEAGFQWVAFNVGDHPEPEWSIWADAAIDHGLDYGPWARCHTVEHVRALVGAFPESPFLICNLEQEATEPRWRVDAEQVAEMIAEHTTGSAAAVSTEPWLPDNFSWQAFAARAIACLPQAFETYTPRVVTERARQWFSAVYPTCAAYHGNPSPDDYRTQLAGQPFSVYASDDVPDWKAWAW